MAKNGELTPKRQRFVQEYLVDKNATQAAIRAGYSKRTAQEQGSRLLSYVMVMAAVSDGLAKQTAAVVKRQEIALMTKAEWLAELQALAKSDVTDLAALSPDGKLSMSLADIKARGLGKLIRKMKVMPGGKVEFELHPKLPALEMFGKHFGFLVEQTLDLTPAAEALEEADLQAIFASPESIELARQLAMKVIDKPKAGKVKGGSDGKDS